MLLGQVSMMVHECVLRKIPMKMKNRFYYLRRLLFFDTTGTCCKPYVPVLNPAPVIAMASATLHWQEHVFEVKLIRCIPMNTLRTQLTFMAFSESENRNYLTAMYVLNYITRLCTLHLNICSAHSILVYDDNMLLHLLSNIWRMASSVNPTST